MRYTLLALLFLTLLGCSNKSADSASKKVYKTIFHGDPIACEREVAIGGGRYNLYDCVYIHSGKKFLSALSVTDVLETTVGQEIENYGS